jgi:hypothetical protein
MSLALKPKPAECGHIRRQRPSFLSRTWPNSCMRSADRCCPDVRRLLLEIAHLRAVLGEIEGYWHLVVGAMYTA